MTKKKIVYIAHPISGNVEDNIDEVLQIVRHLNLIDSGIVPFAPYLVDVQALDDNNPDERKRGIENGHALFHSGVVDEVWLYGPTISKGMAAEIDHAHSLSIPVIAMTPATKAALPKYTASRYDMYSFVEDENLGVIPYIPSASKVPMVWNDETIKRWDDMTEAEQSSFVNTFDDTTTLGDQSFKEFADSWVDGLEHQADFQQ